MDNRISREAALELLRKYNKDPFHLRHALTVEAVMRWYARELGYAEEEEFCGGVGEDMIHATCSHAYGMHVYRNGKKVLELAGKAAPKVIREDKLCGMLAEVIKG